ncbi:MAG: FxLYD domain-containing protein [Alphaproteobacteria bacterium]|nr:FxLYD domain-containing protein [Alphaproteobacteria bacterium]
MQEVKEYSGRENIFFVIVAIIVACLVSIIIFPSANISSDKSDTVVVEHRELPQDVELLEHDWCYGDYGIRYVCGTVINNTTRDMKLVVVDVNLYDESGVQVDSNSDTITNLEAGGKWKFEVGAYDSRIVSYKIKEVVHY